MLLLCCYYAALTVCWVRNGCSSNRSQLVTLNDIDGRLVVIGRTFVHTVFVVVGLVSVSLDGVVLQLVGVPLFLVVPHTLMGAGRGGVTSGEKGVPSAYCGRGEGTVIVLRNTG